MTLTPEMVEIERAAFEADWCTRRPLWRSWAFDRSLDWPNEYASSTVQDCWETWLARAQSQRAVAWMPIDTAPKDEHAPYLALIPGNDMCDVLVLQVSNFEGGTYADCRDGLIDWTDRITMATHWMPIALIDRAGGGV